MTTAALASPLDATHQWRIVLARDRRYDGDFVYAVRSTGIYCRPSCPSRRPRRTLVRFFPIPEAAEAAGFRACRRCHPRQVAPHDPAVALVRELCRVIDAQLDGTAAPRSSPSGPAGAGSASARASTATRSGSAG